MGATSFISAKWYFRGKTLKKKNAKKFEKNHHVHV